MKYSENTTDKVNHTANNETRANVRDKTLDYSLYLITDRKILQGRDLITEVIQAVRGGVSLVQLREKELCVRDFYNLARELKQKLDELGVPLIINNNVDIAMAVDAAGVHLGDEDLPVDVARRLLGREKVIGRSVSGPQEAVIAQEDGADYLGLGPVYPTSTKAGADQGLSTDTIAKVFQKVDIPVVGIGGIDKGSIYSVREHPFSGIAVVSAILAERDCYLAAKQLRELWDSPLGEDGV